MRSVLRHCVRWRLSSPEFAHRRVGARSARVVAHAAAPEARAGVALQLALLDAHAVIHDDDRLPVTHRRLCRMLAADVEIRVVAAILSRSFAE